MRDYLYHAYDIKSLSVRSFIKQSAVVQGKPSALRPQYKRWYRPRATKKMTVEMDKPFAWPKEPESYEAWNKTTNDKAMEDNQEYQRMRGRLADTLVDKTDRRLIGEQAKALLEGRERWKPVSDGEGAKLGGLR